MATLHCSNCGAKILIDDDVVNPATACPACTHRSDPSPGTAPGLNSVSSAVCAFCLSPINADEALTPCPACRASYHDECWRENGGCAVYGCSQVPAAEPRRSVEIPVSYWGQENKPCPACGQEILAAAVRCRFCGAVFASAAPEDTASFNQRSEQEKRLPQVRQRIVWIFVLSVIPCFAPLGGLWGLVWFPTHRSDIEALPGLYPALCKMGIGVGLGQTLLMVLMAMLYAATRAQ